MAVVLLGVRHSALRERAATGASLGALQPGRDAARKLSHGMGFYEQLMARLVATLSTAS